MAQSPAHRFGQIIGDALEDAIEPLLREFAARHHLYLDKKGPRAARRGKKVSWRDLNDNSHDLDYVLERGGSPTQIGIPVAFIETAWRRYTKHSRAKAQEIQGAILPLRATYNDAGPFIGAVLAGVFTTGALAQLRSLGFSILFFPSGVVFTAFQQVRINAHSTESTPDADFAEKVRAWDRLSARQRARVGRALLSQREDDVRQFMSELERAIARTIQLIRILPLHGSPVQWSSIHAAVEFIEHYDESEPAIQSLVRYEIEIQYENGDAIKGQFEDKTGAIQFLRTFLLPLPTVPG